MQYKYKRLCNCKPGVYAVEVKLVKIKKLKGIANLGFRPTFKGKKILLRS